MESDNGLNKAGKGTLRVTAVVNWGTAHWGLRNYEICFGIGPQRSGEAKVFMTQITVPVHLLMVVSASRLSSKQVEKTHVVLEKTLG